MASVTGIPENPRVATGELQNPHEAGYGEEEPLLGRAGDASQQEGRPLIWNLALGTAIITQTGLLLLIAHVWASIFLSPTGLILFSAHPLLNSGGLLFLTQGILILQPTHTAAQKRQGTLTHAGFNSVALSLLVAGLVVIEVNKFAHRGIHFESAHAILGLTTYILLLLQSLIGTTQYFTPTLYGTPSPQNAKKIYKYHRASGYLILLLMLATIAAATWTPFNENALHIKSWAVISCAVLMLVGIVPRIKKQKLGLGGGSEELRY
ncbi:ddfba0c9-58e8-4ab4-bf2a-cabf86f5da26 [Sclerotinia trifoliorum]|uniref:Ddfba0c9-58e8-4ab4-bf2a-cabf86f5da26 n=1 Tax=Sclerotinia trifoliorum TaxID=28548 RepID=A0A8H2ZQJ2_9HELO|nr:ddfba0c9-58e8-4ab4-bf2a-cabf86f5da26 [Sclerotinia trifoliorum]